MLDSGQVPLGSMLFLGRPQTQEMRLTRAGMSPEFQACLQVPWELTRAHETLSLVPGPACPVSGCTPTQDHCFPTLTLVTRQGMGCVLVVLRKARWSPGCSLSDQAY